MPETSVIIPVFNIEQYLERCLISVLSQKYTDYEIILIDDGSTDRSGEICDRFGKLYDRITVCHQKNMGVSAARNRGLSIAKGKYIVFVDGDDWVGESYLADLNNSDADLVCNSFSLVDVHGKLIKHNECVDCETEVTKETALKLLKNGTLEYMVAKRYKTEIIRQNSVSFNEAMSYAEDTLFTEEYLLHSRTVKVENKFNYFYVKYTNRTTLSNNMSLEKLAVVCAANSRICKLLLAADSKEYEELYYSRIGYSYMSYINNTKINGEHEPLKTYSAISTLMDEADAQKIIKYAPDALWKLSLHPRVISACTSGSKLKLLAACFYGRLSNAIHRRA